MSAQPETRFMCNRCRAEISLPLNEQPALERGKPPADWLLLLLNSATAPPQHLCPSCRTMFRDFMAEPKETAT